MFDVVGWLVLGGVTVCCLVLVLGLGVVSDPESDCDRRPRR